MSSTFPPQRIVQLAFACQEWPKLMDQVWPRGGTLQAGDVVASLVADTLAPLEVGFDVAPFTFLAFQVERGFLEAEALHPDALPIPPGAPMQRIVIGQRSVRFETGPRFAPSPMTMVFTDPGVPFWYQGSGSLAPSGYVTVQPPRSAPPSGCYGVLPEWQCGVDVDAIRNDGQPPPSGWRDRPPLL